MILAILLLALIAVVVGVMREAVILRGDVKALSSLITNPPAPSFLSEALPAPAAHRIPALVHGASSGESRRGESHILAFLSPDCSGCSGLVSDLAAAVKSHALPAQQVEQSISFLVASYEAKEPAVANAARAIGDVIIDPNAELGNTCEVRHTPMLMQIRLPDAIVAARMGKKVRRPARRGKRRRARPVAEGQGDGRLIVSSISSRRIAICEHQALIGHGSSR